MLLETLIKYSSLLLHKIDKTNIRIFLESSPEYPNLLSIIQTLRYVNIDAQVGRCDWDYLQNLKYPFLLHLKIKSKESLAISKWDIKLNCLKILNTKNNKWEIKNKENFDNVWDGVVIYTNGVATKNAYAKDRIVLLSLLGLIVAFTIYILIKQNDISLIDILPIFIGLISSLFVYWRENISKINIIEKICHISSITDCDAVNREWGLWGQKSYMTNISLSFFVSQLLCIAIFSTLSINDTIHTIYTISAIIFLPISIYSVYTQIRVKKICPFCVLILMCVFIEGIIFVFNNIAYIKLDILTIWAISNVFILLILYLISDIYKNKREVIDEKTQLLKLKRKKEIILLESSEVETIHSPIFFGEEDHHINISTIISPSCNHCRKVVFDLCLLIERGIKFRWNIILGKMKEEDAEKIAIWVDSYLYDKNTFIKYLRIWSSRNIDSLDHISNIDKKSSEICNDFDKLINKFGILGFPRIILNGRMLSDIYTTKDIEFIINDLSI